MGQEASHRSPAVVFTIDENFALPLSVTLHSMLSNLRGTEEIDVYVIHPFLSETVKAKLQAVAEQTESTASLTFIEVDKEKHLGHLELDYYGRFTETIYFRLLIESLIPSKHRKVLYLDSDLIVEDNVLKLWSIDLDGQILLASQERTVSCPKFGISRWKELGLEADDPFFNSGVMLIDMEKWRAQDIGLRVLNYLHQYRDSLNMRGNQEGFNAVLAGRWKLLPQRWNVLHYYFDPSLFERFGHPVLEESDLSELIEDPSIIHFTDGPKPWQPGCTHPAQDRFFHYLRQSGWFSYPDYVQWRMQLSAGTGIKWLKDISRPYRHKIGL